MPGELAVGSLRVGTSGALPWSPQVPRALPPVPTLEACARWLVRVGPDHSLARILPCLVPGAAPRGLDPWQLRALEGARLLAAGDLVRGTRLLCGLGPGLTPSGDDFLCGWSLALFVRGEDPQPIAQHAHFTHRIARAYLEAAVRGHAPEAWHRFLRAAEGKDWREPVQSILRTGRTSGADTLAGFLAALRPRPGPPVA